MSYILYYLYYFHNFSLLKIKMIIFPNYIVHLEAHSSKSTHGFHLMPVKMLAGKVDYSGYTAVTAAAATATACSYLINQSINQNL